jgi:small subunit ribosomal protein S20
MPNTPSAKKRLRQSLERRARNRAARSTVRSQIRKVREAIAAGDAATADAQFRVMVKRIDQAAARGVVHPNLAARVKSRLNKALKQVATKGASQPG